MGIIALLVGLLLPALGHATERARRTACRGNLKQIITGALMYANDDSQGHLSNALHDTNDVMTFLYPEYVSVSKIFVCPSTENSVDLKKTVTNPWTGKAEPYDLTGYAGTITNAGTSYELWGFMNHTPDTPNYTVLRVGASSIKVRGVKKTLTTINNYQHHYDAFGLRGVVAGPSQIWLALDGDEPPGIQNYPDRNNNHGSTGGNVSFTDGHVEWIPTKTYLYRCELSQDENRTSP